MSAPRSIELCVRNRSRTPLAPTAYLSAVAASAVVDCHAAANNAEVHRRGTPTKSVGLPSPDPTSTLDPTPEPDINLARI